MKKIRTIGLLCLVALWVVLAVALWFGPKSDYTNAERRKLAQMPELSASTLFSGKFAEDFEEFTLDQFPLRDSFRQVKSLFHYYVLNQSDNNGIYLAGDTVAKMEYPLNTASVQYTTQRFQYLYDSYMAGADCKIYAAMIPDKGYYLAENHGYPAMDYAALENLYQQAMPWADYVDIKGSLNADSYYRTDTHWRQEKLLSVAQTLCKEMGAQIPSEKYTPVVLEEPFYGVYFGQAALPMQPETLTILQSELLDACTVIDPITGATSQVYNMEKLTSPDLYDVFLSGAQPLLVIENPQGETDRELVLFRDSYGSSLAPLILGSYSKVTLVDIRYLHPDQVGDYVTFQNQDVLFLYSTLILNNGRSLK